MANRDKLGRKTQNTAAFRCKGIIYLVGNKASLLFLLQTFPGETLLEPETIRNFIEHNKNTSEAEKE
jgi:hypothetical protein